MRGTNLAVVQTISIVTEECCKCGILWGMTAFFRNERREDHHQFFCPNGHSQSYMGESEAAKNERLLREEQERHKRTISRLNAAEAEQSKLARKLKRVDRGVCPECNRTFANLARHMRCKHEAKKPSP